MVVIESFDVIEWSLFSAFSERNFCTLTILDDFAHLTLQCARARAQDQGFSDLFMATTYIRPTEELEILCSGSRESLIRPCVDCGLYTGRFCDWCKAKDRVPSEEWNPNQHTPLCSKCDHLHGVCHFCRKIHWAQPFPKGRNAPDQTQDDLHYTYDPTQIVAPPAPQS